MQAKIWFSGVPDAEARFSILAVLLTKTPNSVSEAELRTLTARAHGYVGADLSAVVREAGTIAIKRWISASSSADRSGGTLPVQPIIAMSDLDAALTSVRPSALRSIFLETVPVRYADIGGQALTIQKLRECVEWPLLHPDAFERLGVKAPKGVLLYGPPGCSKTLLVRACATESGVNFVAVRGAEVCTPVHVSTRTTLIAEFSCSTNMLVNLKRPCERSSGRHDRRLLLLFSS